VKRIARLIAGDQLREEVRENELNMALIERKSERKMKNQRVGKRLTNSPCCKR